MWKRFAAISVALLILCPLVASEDLFEVKLHSQADADNLRAAGGEALFWTRDGYLILADSAASLRLQQSSLDYTVLSVDLDRERIVIDRRRDRQNAQRFEVLCENDGLRLLLVDHDFSVSSGENRDLFKLSGRETKIEYQPPSSPEKVDLRTLDVLDSLMNLISQDTLQTYTERLQAFTHRLTGTDSNYAARDWIESKFYEFGYTNVVIDPFEGSQLWDRIPVQSYNILAYKIGSIYPERQIVIGGHMDAVPDCPGADDNASGTAATLEMARILQDIETPMTLVFAGWDSEESWMWGSYHYVDEAVARGDDIVLMVNPDMIAHWTNDDYANLYYGPEDAYAELWADIAGSRLGINGLLSGSTASDHLPFLEAGYDVIFVQEGDFSTEYHLPSDSTTYQNFEYMTRMVKATLGLIHLVGQAPPPVELVSVQEPGDGQSQLITWRPIDNSDIEAYRVYYYPISPPGPLAFIEVSTADTSLLVEGLTEGTTYGFYVEALDADGLMSYAHDELTGTPWLVPRAPLGLLAMPLRQAVNLTWRFNNRELDFDHYSIIRDGEIVGTSTDTTYIDSDPALGADLHEYLITATDLDGYLSDTVGIEPFIMRAATLEPDRICALNRSSTVGPGLVDEVETGNFMRQALDGYNFDYFSDTSSSRLRLLDLLDYGVVIVGAETARFDKLATHPDYGGILDTLAYYLSIGGRMVVFGRWGKLGVIDTVDYLTSGGAYDDAYHDWFHIEHRVRTLTDIASPDILQSDLIGAHSVNSDYPALVWDTVATSDHSMPFGAVSGIPCVSFVEVDAAQAEVLYTYDSRTDDPFTEGQPVAWRYLGYEYQYVYFDAPLSFFDRATAIAVLRQAVADLSGVTECCNIRGDINHIGGSMIDISDLVYLVDYMFTGGPPPPCMDEADLAPPASQIDISDIVYMIDWMFTGGPPPPPCL